MMKRLIAAGLIALGLLSPAWAQGTLLLLGVGPGAAGCVPVTLAGGAIFQDAALTNGGWAAVAATKTTNQLASPACATTGAKLTEDGTNTGHFLYIPVTTSVLAQAYTLTTYYQRAVGTRNVLHGVDSSSFASTAYIGVDLSNCTVNIAAGTTGTYTLASGTITGPFTFNGASWCKASLTFTAIVDTGFNIIDTMMSGTSTSYAGDSTSAIGLWGVDLR